MMDSSKYPEGARGASSITQYPVRMDQVLHGTLDLRCMGSVQAIAVSLLCSSFLFSFLSLLYSFFSFCCACLMAVMANSCTSQHATSCTVP